jgi:hypothetical protein
MSCWPSDSLLPLNEAAEHLPGTVSSRKLYRWIRRGVRGVHLDATLIGHFLFTSRVSLELFLDRLETKVRDAEDGESLLEEAGL